jgi:nitrate reductase delta subunit
MKTVALLASLLEYPAPGFDGLLAAAEPAASGFVRQMRALSAEEREELFSATFDINPSCVPYAGIHLFGEENFKRGEFMAALFARYEETGFVPNGDLPDHLANLLRFAAGADDAERRELAEFCLLGPLQKMTASLDGANPYRALLESVRAALEDALPGILPAASPLEQMRSTPCASTGCASCAPPAELEPA